MINKLLINILYKTETFTGTEQLNVFVFYLLIF